MTALVVVLVAVLVAVAAFAAWVAFRPRAWLNETVRRRIVVHCDGPAGDYTLEGTLARVMGDGIELTAANFIEAAGDRTPLAGDAFIPRGRIRFTQVLHGTD